MVVAAIAATSTLLWRTDGAVVSGVFFLAWAAGLAVRPLVESSPLGAEGSGRGGLLSILFARVAPRFCAVLGPYLRPLVLFVVGGILLAIGLRRQLL